MTIQTHYFATRTLARANVEVLNGKLKDFGKDAATGERWAVLVEVPDEATLLSPAYQETQNLHDQWKVLQDAEVITSQRPGIIGEQVLKTPNNKPVRVSWRRNMTAVRLANHLAKVS